MKYRDLIKMIQKDGWEKVRQKGSHTQFQHQSKKGVVTIPMKLNKDVPAGTLNSILKQAGLKSKE